jgi:hypothetical protein
MVRTTKNRQNCSNSYPFDIDFILIFKIQEIKIQAFINYPTKQFVFNRSLVDRNYPSNIILKNWSSVFTLADATKLPRKIHSFKKG